MSGRHGCRLIECIDSAASSVTQWSTYLMAFSTMVVLTTILVICVGHPANLVARRARDQEWRRIANHLCLAALCVCGALTLLTVLQPNGNWLPPAISLCSLAIGATFDVEGCRNEHSL
ncbi:MAG: hypothetical protein ABGX22_13460 [Pirellulaceae bacterium]|jgi:hypothetical protein